MLTEAAQRSARAVGRNAIEDARMRLELSQAWFDEGNFADAKREVTAVAETLRSNRDLRLLLAQALLLQARLHSVSGENDEAVAAADEALAIYVDTLGEKAPAVGLAHVIKAETLARADKIGNARLDLEAAEGIAEGTGLRFPGFKLERELLTADLELWRGMRTEAAEHLEPIVTSIDEHVERNYHRSLLACALLGLGRAQFIRNDLPRARAALERAVALRGDLGPPDNPWLAEARVALADVLISQGEVQAARSLLDQAEAAFARHAPLSHYFLYPFEKVRQRLP
jgi:tetratricopeptide (TPR) repeat protein